MEITKKHVIIGSAILAAVIIIIAIAMVITKENMTGATGSTGGAAGNLLAVDATGNLSVTNIGEQLGNTLDGVPWIIQYTPYTLVPGTFYTTNLIQAFPITYDIHAGALLIVEVQITPAPGGSGIFMFVLTGDINGKQTTKKEVTAGLGGDGNTIGSITNTFKFFFTGISGASNTFNLTAINPAPTQSWGFQGNNMPDYVLMSLAVLPDTTSS